MTDADATIAAETAPSEPRVSTFELFFDLVFVFALTRVTESLAHDVSWAGLGRGVLVFLVLWWAWGAYAWLTNATPTDDVVPRLVMLASMAAMLVVALAVPTAFDGDGLAFAIAYLVVMLLHDVLYAVAADDLENARPAIIRLGATNFGGGLLLVIGGIAEGGTQTALWALAVALTYAGPYITGVEGFTARPGHFVERHGLIVIIALGESIVAIGAGESSDVDWTLVLTASVSIALVGGLWWAYFDREAEYAEHALHAADGGERSRLARDLYSYLHIPIVLGVVLAALGIKKVLADSDSSLDAVVATALGGGVVLFFAALAGIRLRSGSRPSPVQIVTVVVAAALIPLATEVSAITSLTLLALLTIASAIGERMVPSAPNEPDQSISRS